MLHATESNVLSSILTEFAQHQVLTNVDLVNSHESCLTILVEVRYSLSSLYPEKFQKRGQ